MPKFQFKLAIQYIFNFLKNSSDLKKNKKKKKKNASWATKHTCSERSLFWDVLPESESEVVEKI